MKSTHTILGASCAVYPALFVLIVVVDTAADIAAGKCIVSALLIKGERWGGVICLLVEQIQLTNVRDDLKIITATRPFGAS